MAAEHDHQELEGYREHQRAQRARRVETLGGVVTMLLLATIDLGLSSSPPSTTPARSAPEVDRAPEVTPGQAVRSSRSVPLSTDEVELGYARSN